MGGVSVDELKTLWRRLLAFYQPMPKPTEEFYQTWLIEMQKYDISDVREMIAHVERHNHRMPALSEQIAVVDSFNFKRQQVLWQKGKVREREDAAVFWSGQKADDYGKNCIKLIQGMLDGTIERPQFIGRMRELGMLEEADNLEMFYIRGRL